MPPMGLLRISERLCLSQPDARVVTLAPAGHGLATVKWVGESWVKDPLAVQSGEDRDVGERWGIVGRAEPLSIQLLCMN